MSFNSEFEKYAVKHRGLSSNTLHSYGSHLVTAMTPNIIEERPMNVAVMDVYSRLMMDRIIFLGYPVNDEVANIITAQLLFLDSTDRTRDINMYINSPGGSVYSGLGVYDTMQYVTPDVATICIGMAASYGLRAFRCRHQREKGSPETFQDHDAPAQRCYWRTGK
jgi:ATP-dependent Clp protease protease subunit